ncbi:MAG: hypothetical protein JST93_21500 [Acidobacteria bacterium]|nr:hypothetical protein [Acidobacteriota bacterium]
MRISATGRAIESLLEEDGVLWLGSTRGLWQRKGNGAWSAYGAVPQPTTVRRLLRDSRGEIWAGTTDGLFRFRRSGRTDRWTTAEGLCDNFITTLNETPNAIWAGTMTNLFRFSVDAKTGSAAIAAQYGTSEGLPSGYTNDIRYWQGAVWAATFQGMARLLPSGRWQAVELDQSIRNLAINALAVDVQGVLWMGTDGGGVARWAHSGFSNFNEADGLPIRKVWSIFEDRNGELRVVTKDEQHYAINRFDGLRFHPASLSSPFGSMFGWSWGQIAQHADAGDWLLATSAGLLRYDESFRGAPQLTAGLPYANTLKVFVSRDGALWVALYEHGALGLYRRGRGDRHFHKLDSSGSTNLGGPVACLAEDRHGNMWIGMMHGGLFRYRDGKLESIGHGKDVPDLGVRALHSDRHGRLWAGTIGKGLLRIDDPSAGAVRFVAYSRAGGLSDNNIHSIAEDLEGRIYAGGAGTVDRLDSQREARAQVRRFTTADGVISGRLRVAFRDKTGAIWFGGDQGLCRILPAPDPPFESSVVIHSILVNGKGQALSALGETDPAPLSLQSFERQLQVEFGGFRPDLRYQTRLRGVDQDWSAPTTQRSVHYLSLGPGGYELLIRGVSPDGSVSAQPARVRFSIAVPVWRQWWFAALAFAVALGAAYWIHLLLLQRRLAVERIRSRIATDLHDDIGASLSRIAVMSEALQTREATTDDSSRRTLAQIAEESRTMVDDMSDIVWSIDPRRDSMADVVARLRGFGSDVLEPLGIRWTFDAPEEVLRYRLTPDQRRQLYLILKEAIHNVARHSRATSARLSIGLRDGLLYARIEDDGCGYTPDTLRLGVHSMRTRAEQLGGMFHVAPRQEGGTCVSLQFPLTAKNA